MIYRRIARPVLFRLGHGDAEVAHDVTLRALEWMSRYPSVVRVLRALNRSGAGTPRTVFGVSFPNPIGLAAGLDKDGRALPAWPALGFGFVEVGTVTAQAQSGSRQPRLFRLPASGAVINRMGFNNRGARALAAHLAAQRALPVPLGISLGKSKVTPIEDAVGDYLTSLRALRDHGDYFAVNVSSPNTPGLRSLQGIGQLTTLLSALRAETSKPILVKIAPDLTDPAIAELIDVCLAAGAAGLIATNTTLSRDGLAAADRHLGAEAGGLSGRPLAARARHVVAFVHRETGGRLPIIGVGGISDPDDAIAMFDAGASLIQLCTGLIFAGSGLIRDIARVVRQREAADDRQSDRTGRRYDHSHTDPPD